LQEKRKIRYQDQKEVKNKLLAPKKFAFVLAQKNCASTKIKRTGAQ
jgi:hypothetical protein